MQKLRRFTSHFTNTRNFSTQVGSKSVVKSRRKGRWVLLLSLGGLVASHEYLSRSNILFNSSHPAHPYLKDYVIPVEQVVQGTLRFMSVFKTCMHVGAIYKYYEMQHPEQWENDAELRARVHREAAQTFMRLFVGNGGIYIKFGQYMSTMNNMLPKEWTDTLAVLQDHAPWVGIDQVEHLIRGEFGKSISELYAEFEQTPIAAASLAQVHKAKILTDDGQLLDVAVKVQYPKLRFHYTGDMIAKRIFVDLLQKAFPSVDFSWLGPELEEALVKELDFLNERANMKKCEELFAKRSDIYIPKVIDGLTSEKVLTMEFINGVKINDLEGIRRLKCSVKDAARITFEMFAEMVYLYGFLHSDPHPGNVLVRPNPKNKRSTQVVLLDHGLYKQLSEEFRIGYCKLWKAMILHHDDQLKEYCDKLGVTDYKLYAAMVLMRGYEGSSIGMGDHGTMEQWNRLKSQIFDDPEKLTHLFNKMPKDMLLIFRTLSLLRGINQELGIPVNRYEINARVAAKGIQWRNDEEATEKATKMTWANWISMKKEQASFEFVLKWYEWKYWIFTIIYRMGIYMGLIQPFRITVGKDDIDVVLAA